MEVLTPLDERKSSFPLTSWVNPLWRYPIQGLSPNFGGYRWAIPVIVNHSKAKATVESKRDQNFAFRRGDFHPKVCWHRRAQPLDLGRTFGQGENQNFVLYPIRLCTLVAQPVPTVFVTLNPSFYGLSTGRSAFLLLTESETLTGRSGVFTKLRIPKRSFVVL